MRSSDTHALPGGGMNDPFHKGVGVVDKVLGTIVEYAVAIIVLAEICVLFAGVVARYVFHDPIIWSDELASILFLWLSMLGAVVALRRGDHMRMTALVNNVSPGVRNILETLSLTASLAFLVIILGPAYTYAEEEHWIMTPALELSNAWRAAAIPIGIALMGVVAMLKLVQTRTWRQIILSVAFTLAVVAVFILLQPVFAHLGKYNLIVFFVILVAATVFSGVPIAFSFALATFGYLSLTTDTPMIVMVGRMDEGMSHLIMLAVPLFIFLGSLI
jgi:TRAP-type C4-dicarboxylate transport system permease small subunit